VVCYIFLEDYDFVFHRTKYINLMLAEVDTKYVAIWDSDVIVPISQLYLSMNALNTDKADVSFPYDGTFLDVDFNIRGEFVSHTRISYLVYPI